MKKFFRGFTLAELLLCVGIIGIVSAMGMTVAKISTDKAYNSFYYAGYINLYNAIADAKSQGKETNKDIMDHARDLLSKDNVVATLPDDGIRFLTYKAIDLGFCGKNEKEINGKCIKIGEDPGKELPNQSCRPDETRINGVCVPKWQIPYQGNECPEGQEKVNGACRDKCPVGQTRDSNGVCRLLPPPDECPEGQEKVNGICQYKCLEGQTRDENGVCRAPQINPDTFTWPTSDNGVTIETINGIKYYYPNNLSDGMNGVQQLTGEISGVTNAFPITMTVPQRQTRANNGIATVHLIYIDLNGGYLIPVTDDASVDLQNRRDLLPAYVDNGKVGRNNNIINRSNWTYERPAYRSYRETYCLLRGRTVINNVISCDGISANQDGVLAIASPQKAK